MQSVSFWLMDTWEDVVQIPVMLASAPVIAMLLLSFYRPAVPELNRLERIFQFQLILWAAAGMVSTMEVSSIHSGIPAMLCVVTVLNGWHFALYHAHNVYVPQGILEKFFTLWVFMHLWYTHSQSSIGLSLIFLVFILFVTGSGVQRTYDEIRNRRYAFVEELHVMQAERLSEVASRFDHPAAW